MLANISWLWAFVFFFAGTFIGQRFSHLHPAASVKNQ
jgi:hypothetical protein